MCESFIPFYIFSHEKEFPEYESNEVKLQKLCEDYTNIRLKLDDLQKAGVENIMQGKIIEYETETIRNKAIAEGKSEAEGIAETMAKVKDETEERAKDMLRDKMTLSLVKKYTRLPMSRILLRNWS